MWILNISVDEMEALYVIMLGINRIPVTLPLVLYFWRGVFIVAVCSPGGVNVTVREHKTGHQIAD